MNDCANGGEGRWRKPKWTTQEWRAPDGHAVFLPADETPCVVSVVFRDGTSRDFVFALNGRAAEGVSVDGERFDRVGECVMELIDTDENFDYLDCREEYLMCSACGYAGYHVWANEDGDYGCVVPNFCPVCGAKVVSA